MVLLAAGKEKLPFRRSEEKALRVTQAMPSPSSPRVHLSADSHVKGKPKLCIKDIHCFQNTKACSQGQWVRQESYEPAPKPPRHQGPWS